MAGPSFAALGRALNGDPVHRVLPGLSQYAWLRLAAAMIQQGLTALRIGSQVLSPAQAAAFAGMTVAEWDAHTPALFEVGLLSIEDDGAIGCPSLLPPMRDLFGGNN